MRSVRPVLLAAAVVLAGALAIPAVAKPAAGPVLLPVPGDPAVSFKLAFTFGTQNDPAGKEGLAYLTAQMMSEGATKKHAYNEILALLYPMAAGYGVRVDKQLTTFSGRVHRDNVDAYTGLLLEAILEPAFREDDFARIRQRTRDFITKQLRYSSDEELGKQTLYSMAFAGSPYQHLNAGSVAGLDAITLDDIRAFHAAHVTGANLVLGLGGGYDKALLDRVQAGLAKLPAGKVSSLPPPAVAPLAGRPVTIVNKPGAATAISFGHPIDLKRGARDFYALWLANSWLGEHRNSSSHLYQVIREERGMNYGDYSYIEIFPEGGFRSMPPTNVPRSRQLFEVWIRPVPNNQAHFALRAAMREVELLARNGLTENQFAVTKSFLSKYCLHFAETTSDRLGYALDDRIYGIGAPGHLEQFRRIAPTLTRDEVNAAIRKHLKPANLHIAIVSALGDTLADHLAAGAASPMTYATPKPQSVLDEDKVIETWPLGIERKAIRVVPVDRMFER